MTVNDIYTFVNESHWEVFVPLYFFLISISAGSLMVASFSTVFGLQQYRNIVRPAVFTSLITLVLAPFFLILDLGQPLRFLYVLNPANFNIQSPMSWGGWLLILYGITLILIVKKYVGTNSSVQTIAETAATTVNANSKLLYVFGFVFALLLSAYPGLELGVVTGKALWNSPILPIYFITTSLLGGIGILMLVNQFGGKKEAAESFIMAVKPVAICLIILSFVWIVSRSMILSTSGLQSEFAAQSLWKSGWFVWGELVLGLILPLAFLLFGNVKKNQVLLTLIGGLLLIGVFAMRYSVVFAGLQ